MRSRALLAMLVCLLAGATAAWAAESVSVRVLEDSGDRIVINYTIGDFTEQPVIIDGFEYTQITLPGESKIKVVGAPEVPRFCGSVIVPDDATMAARVIASKHVKFTEVDLAPSKGILSREVNPKNVPYTFGEPYNVDADYPGALVQLREPYIMRDFRGQVVVLNPFQYNAVARTLRVYTSVTVEVLKTGPGQINVLQRNGGLNGLSPSWGDVYASHFFNYGPEGRYAPLTDEGDMLIICHDAWLANVQPLVDHKNSIGIDTTAVGVSTIPGGNNATSIKNYIQSVYDTSDLAFVLLVGDSAQVATPQASGGASDPTYSKLTGDDDYPDILVGRFSASTVAHVDTQVERTIEYENMPATGQDWFWKGTGIASSLGAGIGDEGQSDIQHENEIRDWLMGDGWTEVDQIYDPGATAAQVAAALNSGRGIVNYTGHGGTTSWTSSGFSNSDVDALVNDNMLPFICSVACKNGQFDGYTCFAEAWLRATNGSEPTGAIGIYASSINQSWAPPMEAQDEFNILLTNPSGPYHSFGALCYAGSCSMMDDYGSGGVSMFNTWILFGDPSLRVISDSCNNGVLDLGEDRIDCGGPCPACDCTSDGQCDNGQFCDGVETCDDWGHCLHGEDPCEPDQTCDEDSDVCLQFCATLPVRAVCRGDANGDARVDTLDTGMIEAAYGLTDKESLCKFDINCDGAIDTLDIGLAEAAYGACTPESANPCWME